MIATHAMTFNGRYSGELKDSIRPITEELRRAVFRLDAERWYATSLWALPPGKALDQVPHDFPVEYIQTAGSADRLTVEIRELVDGVPVQYVIGRQASSALAATDWASVRWSDHEVPVLANEVLTAEDAFILFSAYHAGAPLPSGYVRRPR